MIVLDTHVWFWAVTAPDRLSEASLDSIQSADEVSVSAITCWEISMLAEKGRIALNMPVCQWLEDALSSSGTILLPIVPAVGALAARLPMHGDPADRLIVATAITAGCELVTKDHQIRTSGLVSTIW